MTVFLSRTTPGPSAEDQEPPELPPMAEEVNQLGKLYSQSLNACPICDFSGHQGTAQAIPYMSSTSYIRLLPSAWSRAASCRIALHQPAIHVIPEAFVCVGNGMTAQLSIVNHGSQSFWSADHSAHDRM